MLEGLKKSPKIGRDLFLGLLSLSISFIWTKKEKVYFVFHTFTKLP